MSPTCVTPTRYLLEEQGERRMERRKIKRLGNEVGSCRQRDEEWRAEGGALWSGFVPIHTGRTEVLSHSRAQRPSLSPLLPSPAPMPGVNAYQLPPSWLVQTAPRLTSLLNHWVGSYHPWHVTGGFVRLSYAKFLRSFISVFLLTRLNKFLRWVELCYSWRSILCFSKE